MTDHLDSLEEPGAAGMAALGRLLARPDVWHEPPAGLEQAVVAAIARSTNPAFEVAAIEPAAASLDEQQATRRDRSAMPWWLAAAAVVSLVVAGIAIANRGSDDRSGGVEIAMRGTEAAPGATAAVVLSATPAGLKILLDADGLPGAPDGYYYEAWVSDGTTRVSAGTFHLRRGDNEIELWAGVVEPAFDTLTVTLEPIDADTDSSGDVQLIGSYELSAD